MTEKRINEIVHKLYWEQDVNCAGTILRCLGEAFQVKLDRQVLSAAAGMHGAGGYRAQCGLVEGVLLFIGIYCELTGKDSGEAAKYCYEYAEAFTDRFGSLRCFDLRPGGFTEQDPPHLCEKLTCEAVLFACEFIGNRMGGEPVADAWQTDVDDMILRMAGREDCVALTEMRMAFLEDEHGCLACEKDAVMRRQILRYFESHLEQDLYAFTAVDRCGNMAASAFLMIAERPAMPDCLSGKVGTVFNVYTKPGYRRQGMAYRLMEMLLKKAEEAGVTYVDLKATKDGYELYRKLGFKENTSVYTDMRYWVEKNVDG